MAALWNHNSDLILGRMSNKTLTLAEDETGLAIEFQPPDTQMGQDAVTIIERGDVYQMSFAFRTIKDLWHTEDGMQVRELLEVQLFDVSPVTYPAYPQTDVNVRGLVVIPNEINPPEPGPGSHSDDETKAEAARVQLKRRMDLDLMELENK